MGSIVEDESCCTYSKTIEWSSETNWAITHGSFRNSINIESSEYPLSDPDLDVPNHNPHLVLEPRGMDSGPCEINLCFNQKYEISQIYVRSSARVYEVYYASSPQSSNEYLCTVRCGIAERDDKVLQTASFKDVSSVSGGYSVGEVSDEIAKDGETIVNSDDDWVKIKVSESEVGRSSFSDCTSINKGNIMQDLYEATAEISDADPCSSLTIRLLSLQDKSHVHVDEVYIFVDPVESTDSENVVPALSSAQSPLMAMLMPTLMQLSATGANRGKDKLASDESDNDDNMKKNQVDTQYFKLKELDKDAAESDEINQPPLALNAKKCGESSNINDIPLGRVERSLEQLLSRFSTVEDICLSFEEKMLKPIQSMAARLEQVENKLETGLKQIENKFETRLQQVELQMEKLCKNIHNSDLPRCTRISAPEFSCGECKSSSFDNDGRDCTIFKASEIAKKYLSCNNNMPDPSQHADIRPGLVVTVPEFSCGDEEEDSSGLKELEDTPCTKPKKTLSVDDALAAALSGFLSTAKIQHTENVEKDSGLSSEEDGGSEHIKYVESGQIDAPDAEPLSYTQILSITAPDFTTEEIEDEQNDENVLELKKVLPIILDESLFTSADSSCDLNINESVNELESDSHGSFPAGEVNFNGISTNLLESSRSSSLDFDFPILEVKFNSDAHASLENPLEALLDGEEAEFSVQAQICDGSVDGDDDDDDEEIIVVDRGNNGTTEHFLVDIGCSAADCSLNLDVGLDNSCTTPSSPEMTVSLI